VSSLGEVGNEAMDRSPLLFMTVEDGYGRRCGLPWLIGLIVSKLELEPHDAFRKPSFLRCCGVSSTLPLPIRITLIPKRLRFALKPLMKTH
jgi:hypothetical protein